MAGKIADSVAINDAINRWSDGSQGHFEDRRLIVILHELCRQYGYDLVATFAGQLDAIAKDPGALADFKLNRLIQLQKLRGELDGHTRRSPLDRLDGNAENCGTDASGCLASTAWDAAAGAVVE